MLRWTQEYDHLNLIHLKSKFKIHLYLYRFVSNNIQDIWWRVTNTTDLLPFIIEKYATGFDEINAEYLKMSMAFVANPLVYICNMSLSEGVFPTPLKTANVEPLYKCDDPMLFNHYRPLSLLCTLSKVFEKAMYNRLIKFLEKSLNSIWISVWIYTETINPFSTYYIDWQIDPGNRKWRICYRCVFRLFKCFWYRKSWNTVGQIISLWRSWLCTQMVLQLIDWSTTICNLQWNEISKSSYKMWCTTRINIRSTFISHIHKWPTDSM